jgi:hypothetical protein
VTDIATELREAADLAERAAVQRQHAELDGPSGAPAIIAGLELAADTLRHAAKRLAPPPVASRRVMTDSVLMISVSVISCVALLLTVPNPAQPLVLAVTLAGTTVVSKLVRDVVVAILDWRHVRRLGAAVNEPEDVQRSIAEQRTRIRAITDALEPDRNDLHLEVGRQIESAQVWIDGADHALAETPER